MFFLKYFKSRDSPLKLSLILLWKALTGWCCVRFSGRLNDFDFKLWIFLFALLFSCSSCCTLIIRINNTNGWITVWCDGEKILKGSESRSVKTAKSLRALNMCYLTQRAMQQVPLVFLRVLLVVCWLMTSKLLTIRHLFCLSSFLFFFLISTIFLFPLDPSIIFTTGLLNLRIIFSDSSFLQRAHQWYTAMVKITPASCSLKSDEIKKRWQPRC